MLRRCCSITSLMLACAAAPASAGDLTSLELLGETALPATTQFGGVPLGGLSGLAFDARSGRYLALSDDRSENGPARFYRLAIGLPAPEPGSSASAAATQGVAVTVEGATTLVARGGAPFPRRGLDPEGIALGSDRIFISSEGEAKVGQAPFVQEFDLDGRFVRELAPARALPPRGRGRSGCAQQSGLRGACTHTRRALPLHRRRERTRAGERGGGTGCSERQPAAAMGSRARRAPRRVPLSRRGDQPHAALADRCAGQRPRRGDRPRPRPAAHARTPVAAWGRHRDEALRGDPGRSRRMSPASIRRRAWRWRRRRRPWCSTSPIWGCRSTTSKAWRSAHRRPTAGVRWSS